MASAEDAVEQSSSPMLTFQLAQSSVAVEFWKQLAALKLNILRLSEEAVPITGTFTAGTYEQVASPVQLDAASFSSSSQYPQVAPLRKDIATVVLTPHAIQGHVAVPGQLRNLNTLESFVQLDKPAALQALAGQIWADICSGAAEEDPALLWRFLVLSFADLKKYSFTYWFCFPALKPPQPFRGPEAASLAAESALGDQAELAVQACQGCIGTAAPTTDDKEASPQGLSRQQPCGWLVRQADGKWSLQPLSAWRQVTTAPEEHYLVVPDPGNFVSSAAWPVRNLLLMAAARWKLHAVRVVCLRSLKGRFDAGRSLLLRVDLPDIHAESYEPKASGWEANKRGAVRPRHMDLGVFLDPRQLAESAVDLNLRLMRWRVADGLDLDRLAATSCLLLGAGTLGCAVARTLLGWGVRKLTFLDSSRVAFSNPVRQSLFEFQDCLEGGKPKAAAAAEAVRRIFPSADVASEDMWVRMPGHRFSATERPQVEADVDKLRALIDSHDVVFLLMDTREARWLPTVLAAAAGKLAINAALGFDSFVVMRHGLPPIPEGSQDDRPSTSTAPTTPQLGCYFCYDIVAPMDSTVDRTLDQQCTVARPGLAPIAGALAVEVMAAALQHPLGAHAPAAHAPAGQLADAAAGSLGPIPHMIRGQLSGGFEQRSMVGHAYQQCTACSLAVLQALQAGGTPFVLDALLDPKMLEDLTGLTEMKEAAARAEAEMEDDAWPEASDAEDQDDWAAV